MLIIFISINVSVELLFVSLLDFIHWNLIMSSLKSFELSKKTELYLLSIKLNFVLNSIGKANASLV